MGERVLVTGIAGFIGFHTAQTLLEKGISVVGIDNLNDYYDPILKLARLKELGIEVKLEDANKKWYHNGGLSFYRGDISHKDDLNKLYNKKTFDSVIHLAAQAGVRYSIENPDVYIESNIVGFFNVLEFCRHQGIKTLTYASSSSVYGDASQQPFSEEERCDKPISLYAATKRSNELMAYTYSHLYGVNNVGLRLFTVYGPWGRPDMAPIIFAKAALEEQTIQVFNNGNQLRDFTYIDDIVEGIVRVHEQNFKLRNKDGGYAKVMNIGNGKPISLMSFIDAVERFTEKVLSKEYVEAQSGDVSITYADTSLLEQFTGYKPKVTVDQGMKKFIDWYVEYRNKN